MPVEGMCEPQLMTPEERFTLEKLDTPDGLLKTVLKHVAQGSPLFE